MKKLILSLIFSIFVSIFPLPVFAQENHTAAEEAKGKEIQEKLLNKQLACQDLSDEDFQALGEFYMGQMTGESHEQMNQMMIQMMGEDGERQMHIAMGKRLSGCDTSAQVPSQGTGFMPMMWMMGRNNPMTGTDWGNMMGGWNGFGVFGWLSMILFWILLILSIVALLRYLGKPGQQNNNSKTPLAILKERYAQSEIDKKEFEDKKKDLA